MPKAVYSLLPQGGKRAENQKRHHEAPRCHRDEVARLREVEHAALVHGVHHPLALGPLCDDEEDAEPLRTSRWAGRNASRWRRRSSYSSCRRARARKGLRQKRTARTFWTGTTPASSATLAISCTLAEAGPCMKEGCVGSQSESLATIADHAHAQKRPGPTRDHIRRGTHRSQEEREKSSPNSSELSRSRHLREARHHLR